MSFTRAQIDASYAASRQAARLSGSNFYPSFLLLPSAKRRAMEALYAFMRRTDDLVDNNLPLDQRRRAIDQWRTEVEAALGGGPDSAQPLLPAVADTVDRFEIPTEHLFAVIDGVEMDLDRHGYETFDELADYCHRVASAVGMVSIYVWGFDGPEAFEPARQCGLALQLTNILRDLKEDAAEGRVYLPAEDLRRCGYTPDDLAAGVVDQRFLRLVKIQTDRARSLYREGAELIYRLHPDGRRIFGMLIDVYYRLFLQIERDPAQVFRRRVQLSRRRKLMLAARWTLLPPRRSSLP